MASDKTRALLGFGRLAVAAVLGYAIYAVWIETRIGMDEWYVPIGAGLVATLMAFLLLSKLKGGD
ncbi:MAG: hypothetical protein NTV88_06110 [Candidatus Micrarchaeota archaeon]|nr:hypothetical protein [Candidatus Micrarchaeota archaeon]